ncbi:MAG: hypothetical protein HUU50_14780 [Candidatus Brocadiae bacterium]|nr:hypothetical protein [Candidatus Brocadiia bacterium]
MITAIELLPEGKILASGIATNAITLRDFGMIRYHANGNVDTSFGTNGKVKVDFNGGDDRTNAMAVLSDGKILLAGGKSQGTWGTFGIAKFNSNGTLDTTFGTEGKVSTGFSEFSAVNCEAFCMSVLSDGKFLLAGVVNKASWDFAIAKYNADGSLDTTFGTGGKVVTDFNGQADYGLCMIVLEDGKILVGGSVYNAANTNSDFALARYNANGTLDSTFGTNGKVTTDFPYSGNDGIESLAVLADGKIIAAGNASPYNGSFAIACYHANGALDTTFGTNGQVTTDFNPASLDAIVKIKVFPDGKILAGGYANSGTNIDFALARYNADGSMDSRFGTGGKVTTDFATIDDRIVAVAIQPDGKIVAAGKSDTNFALARYMGDSKLISLQIGALPKDQGGLSEYLLKWHYSPRRSCSSGMG